jgi:Cft2 family RNA processing exonuclease
MKNIFNPRVILTNPMSYSEYIYLLSKCLFCFSDSGGLQEEAIILKKRCLIPSDYTPHNYYLAKNANYILKLDDKNYKSKKVIEARFSSVLNEYRERVEELKKKNATLEQESQMVQSVPQGLTLDEEKEAEILKKLKDIELKKVFLTHGEEESMLEFSQEIQKNGFKEVILPAKNETYLL